MGQARRLPRKILKMFTGSSLQGYLVKSGFVCMYMYLLCDRYEQHALNLIE